MKPKTLLVILSLAAGPAQSEVRFLSAGGGPRPKGVEPIHDVEGRITGLRVAAEFWDEQPYVTMVCYAPAGADIEQILWDPADTPDFASNIVLATESWFVFFGEPILVDGVLAHRHRMPNCLEWPLDQLEVFSSCNSAIRTEEFEICAERP